MDAEIPRTNFEVSIINGYYVYANDFEPYSGLIIIDGIGLRIIDGLVFTPTEEDQENARRATESWKMGFFKSGE